MNNTVLKIGGTLLFALTLIMSAKAFTDVQKGQKFQPAIDFLFEQNFVQGYSDGTFKPNRKINRYDFTKIIIASKFSEKEIQTCNIPLYSFPDIPRFEWFSPYVCVAKKYKIINGYHDGFFRGENEITTPEALKIILETYKEDISQNSQSEWYVPYIETGKKLGLLREISGHPGHKITRGEMAELIYLQENRDRDDIVGSPQDTSTPKTNTNKNYKEVLTSVFWVGEGADDSNGFISNVPSAWDGNWAEHFGGIDALESRCGDNPCGFIPKENPFYFALPYNDLDDNGDRKQNAKQIPWYEEEKEKVTVLKNRWIEVIYHGRTCYGQWEDVGPFHEDDFSYVFGNAPHKNTQGIGAGLDVSPALYNCLGMHTNVETRWRFVDRSEVTSGPWTAIETTSGARW